MNEDQGPQRPADYRPVPAGHSGQSAARRRTRTVEVCEELGKGYAKSGTECLRRYGREVRKPAAAAGRIPVTATSHPKWLVKMLSKAWPDDWQAILQQNNERPPLCLRVNRRHGSRDDYLARLTSAGIDARAAEFSADGIYLAESCDITQLPGFAEGDFSVQDEGRATGRAAAGAAGRRTHSGCLRRPRW